MNHYRIGSLAFVGCMFAGMGIGYATGNFSAGMFVGMGIGFAFKALLFLKAREEQAEDSSKS